MALGSSDAFVTKFDKYGNHKWSIKFGGINSFATSCHSLSVDDSGNVLITGSFSYTVDFDPGPGIYNLSSSGGNDDAFICKLNGSGSLQWAIDFGNNSWDFGFDITTDSLGNIYATGSFSGSVDFDPGPGAFIYSTITGASHTYILKLTSTGNFIWAKQFGAGWSVYAYTLKLDNLGNIYTSGDFAGICDFNPKSYFLLNFFRN
ncbi:MAG: SBBP repeat-containing protein [Bacteroidetes bacterium]|nr:SBBP repeat-containing protein [Bacteroidota bacterium]